MKTLQHITLLLILALLAPSPALARGFHDEAMVWSIRADYGAPEWSVGAAVRILEREHYYCGPEGCAKCQRNIRTGRGYVGVAQMSAKWNRNRNGCDCGGVHHRDWRLCPRCATAAIMRTAVRQGKRGVRRQWAATCGSLR